TYLSVNTSPFIVPVNSYTRVAVLPVSSRVFRLSRLPITSMSPVQTPERLPSASSVRIREAGPLCPTLFDHTPVHLPTNGTTHCPLLRNLNSLSPAPFPSE